MPKQAIIASSAGQRAAVGAFMVLLLAAVTGLAVAAAYRPGLSVDVAGLGLELPPGWRVLDEPTEGAATSRVLLENERRPAMRAVVSPLRIVDTRGQGVTGEPEAMLRAWFPAMTLTPRPLPADAPVNRLSVDGLEVAYWSGVLRSRVPVFGQSSLSLVGTAVVTDASGGVWSIVLRDDHYRHEDPAERSAQHRARLVEVLETLRAPGDS
ncbi:MAG: hypothetical protein AAF916_09510 [Planctomycetota bacterium]